MNCKNCEHFDEKLNIPCKIMNYHDLKNIECLLLHIIWLLRGFEIEREEEHKDDNWWKDK